MMIIAAGFRQTHDGPDGKKVVKFDQGMYDVPEKAHIDHHDGSDWVWCEAHADEETGEGYAEIGGKRMKLTFNPYDQNGKKTSANDDED